MQTDCAYFIGQSHAVCQDYAAVNHDAGSAWAFLSDGCSGSPNTDIGARLLVRAAQRLLPQGADVDAALALAATCAQALGLPEMALDATLMTISTDGTQFRVCCAGDGVAVLERRDGTRQIHSVQYPTGCPDYLSYRLSPSRRARYAAQDSGRQVTTLEWTPGEGISRRATGSRREAVWTGQAKDYRAVAVISDGVHSFGSLSPGEAAPEMAQVVAELMAFKTRRGAFAQRRAQAFRRDCLRRGWRHGDDVSFAAVLWDDDTLEEK